MCMLRNEDGLVKMYEGRFYFSPNRPLAMSGFGESLKSIGGQPVVNIYRSDFGIREGLHYEREIRGEEEMKDMTIYIAKNGLVVHKEAASGCSRDEYVFTDMKALIKFIRDTYKDNLAA